MDGGRSVAWDASPEIFNHHLEPPPGLLLDPQFVVGVRIFGAQQLCFDVWAFHSQLSEVDKLARPARAMFESNFPPNHRSCSYLTLWNAYKRIAEPYNQAERGLMFHDTALATYRLSRLPSVAQQIPIEEFPHAAVTTVLGQYHVADGDDWRGGIGRAG